MENTTQATEAKPIPMRLPCPKCHELHIDGGEFSTRVHHTHSCQHCGLTWRPAVVPTVGVRFLPGFKNDGDGIDWDHVLPHSIRVECAECTSNTNAPGTYNFTFQGGKWLCEKHSKGIGEVQKEYDRLKAKYDLHFSKATDEYWAWQGDGDDHLQTLVCPMLIPADVLRATLLRHLEAIRGLLRREQVSATDHMTDKGFAELVAREIESSVTK